MGLESLQRKTEGSTQFHFFLSSFKNARLLLLQRAMKINYLTYTKYCEFSPYNSLTKMQAPSILVNMLFSDGPEYILHI